MLQKCIFTTYAFTNISVVSVIILCRFTSVSCIDIFPKQVKMQRIHGIYLSLVCMSCATLKVLTCRTNVLTRKRVWVITFNNLLINLLLIHYIYNCVIY